MTAEIIIIGGGASGLMAAIEAENSLWLPEPALAADARYFFWSVWIGREKRFWLPEMAVAIFQILIWMKPVSDPIPRNL